MQEAARNITISLSAASLVQGVVEHKTPPNLIQTVLAPGLSSTAGQAPSEVMKKMMGHGGTGPRRDEM